MRFRVYGYDKMMDGDDVIIQAILPLNELIRDSSKYKFMPSTSCQDKNGKEIYQQDIVLFLDKERFEVVYYHSGFVLVNLETRVVLGHLHNFLDYIEVIGNVYEGVVKEYTIMKKG